MSEDFTPKIIPIKAPEKRRELIDFLPDTLQSDLLKKFFTATVDQWFQPKNIAEVNGFIGRKNGLVFRPEKDFYIPNGSKDRNDYQLEPTAISINQPVEVIEFVQVYQDLINQLRFQGANTVNQSRLLSQECYSWSPPINVDAYINFSNYYWIIEGPQTIEIPENTNIVLDILGEKTFISAGGVTFESGMRVKFLNDDNIELNGINFIVEGVGRSIQLIDDTEFDNFVTFDLPASPFSTDQSTEGPDYITIGRGSQNKNGWSRSNRWFHRDVIPTINSEDFRLEQARKPIVEFIENIELRDFGRFARKDIDIFVEELNIIDIAGQPAFQVDGVDFKDGQRVLFVDDVDPTKNNRVYIVQGIESIGQISFQLSIDSSQSTANPIEGDVLFVKTGGAHGGIFYQFDGANWISSQAKISFNQAPLFNLYNIEGTRLDDQGIFPGNNFKGSEIYGYLLDNNLLLDAVTFLPLTFDEKSNIQFENFIASEDFTFELDFETITIPGYYFYRLLNGIDPKDDTFEDDWHTAAFESRQPVRDEFVIKEITTTANLLEFTREFALSVAPDANTPTKENIQVFLNGRILTESIDFDVVDDILELSITLDLADNDVLETRSFVETISNKKLEGFFEIPNNLESNPNNLEVGTVSVSDVQPHLVSVIENQPGLVGNAFGPNDYRNTIRDLSVGEKMLQHTASLLKLMLLTGKDNLDLLTALRFTGREYQRFRRKFVNKIFNLRQTGFDSSVPSSEWVLAALKAINIGKTDDFAFAFSKMTAGNNFIPSTPSSLGITRAFKPEIFLDNTRITPTTVIRGHDGSLTDSFGDSDLDNALLELENQIFNNIDPVYIDPDYRREFDLLVFKPGFFRKTEYSIEEWNNLGEDALERWTIDNRLNFKENVTFDSSNELTFNYSSIQDPNGDLLPGNWRGIFDYFYDTDRPDTNPWEMLGFPQKPVWWDAEYGSPPYSSGNLNMWNDIEAGFIKIGALTGAHEHLKRPGLSAFIPVDENGDVLTPVQIGLASRLPITFHAKQPWVFGDIGPGEYTFRTNEIYDFAVSEQLYLAKPAKFVDLFWDARKLLRAPARDSYLLYNDTFKRRRSDEFIVHNEILADGTRTDVRGISQWISFKLKSLRLDEKENFGDIVRNLDVKLGHRLSGYTKLESLTLLDETFGLVPSEDVAIELYESNSTEENVYSGILIEWNGKEFVVSGYDTVNQFFNTIPGEPNGKKVIIDVGNVSIGKLNQSSGVEEKVQYLTTFPNRSAVFNFLVSYQRFLEQEGWIFETLDESIAVVKDFEFSGKQFLQWTSNILQPGDTLILSPLANKAEFKSNQGLVDSVQMFTNGVFSLLDRNAFGISINDINVSRLPDKFILEIKDDGAQGFHSIRLSLKEFEHIILVNNVTKFNDLMYSPLLGLRQNRFRISAQITQDWKGRPEAPGFIINENTIIENFDTVVENIQHYYNFEDDNFATNIGANLAKRQIGFQKRDYLTKLLLNTKSQFEFYRGFIREKGTSNSFLKILRNEFITDTADFDVQEEWAFRLGTYGNTESQTHLQIQLIDNDFKTNPQVIVFSEDNFDNPEDSIISLGPDDDRWVLKRNENLTINQFPLRGFQENQIRKDLPTAGIVQIGEAKFTRTDESSVADLFFDTIDNNQILVDGDLVWVFITPNNSWTIYRLSFEDKIKSVVEGSGIGAPGIITLENDHNLVTGDRIFILKSTESSPDLVGFREVVSVNGVIDFTVGLVDVDEVLQESVINISKTFALGAGPDVLVLRKVRFDDNTARDTFLPPNGFNVGDRVFVDDNGSGLWAVYERNTTNNGFDTVRIENDRINTDQVLNTLIYNSITNINKIKPNLYDPVKGLIVGLADKEIFYKLEFDPAKYTDGDKTKFQIDPDFRWGSIQTGRLWWDISTTRFIDYEQSDLEYRKTNWGRIAPGTTIDIYEWTKSPVQPSNWDSFVNSFQGVSQSRPSGTVKDGDNTPFVTEQIFNPAKGTFDIFFFFWVLKPSFIPEGAPARNLSAQNVSTLIANTRSQNVAWFAPITQNAFLLSGIENLLTDDDNILQINFSKTICDNLIHRQWLLARENDSVNPPDERLWDKMRDSLVGFDRIGQPVPDPTLREFEKPGMLIRPRQTWFKNKLRARDLFLEKANKILLSENVVDNNPNWDDNIRNEDPQPEPAEYNFLVFNRNDRDALIGTIIEGEKVLVEQDQVFNNKWSLWELDANNEFILLKKQLFKDEQHWKNVDWYAEGFSAKTRIFQTFPDLPTRDATGNVFFDGEVIKVEDNGAGRFAIYEFNINKNGSELFIAVGQENGTLQFDRALSIYDIADTVLDAEFSQITLDFINALRRGLLTIVQENQLMFTMVFFILDEQQVVDWLFKTSYIFGIANASLLTQTPIFEKDLTENLFEYIEEVKPYRTKIRGFIERKEAALEEANFDLKDTHEIKISMKYDRVECKPTISIGAVPGDFTKVELEAMNAADRTQLLYQSSEGMPEKVLEQLISRCETANTIVDGKNFFQFGTLLGLGYDNSEYDFFHGYDFDSNDLENFYDIFVNGGTFTMPGSLGNARIIVNGNDFIQPHLAANHPEELVPARIGDAVSIEVYTTTDVGTFAVGYDAEEYDIDFGYDYELSDITIPFGGSPEVRIKRYNGNGTAGPFAVGQIPQNRQALFVYVDDLLLLPSEFTVDWNNINPIVTINSVVPTGTFVKIMSFKIGGSGIKKRKLFRNTSDTVFDLSTTFATNSQVLVTVDGELATFTTTGTEITIISPIPTNSAVFIAIFRNDLFSLIRTQEEIAIGGAEVFTIASPGISQIPDHATTMVHLNDLRLTPPKIKFYFEEFGGSGLSFKIGKVPTTSNNVEVILNGTVQIEATDYIVNVLDAEVQFIVTLPPESNVQVILFEDHQFQITGINNDKLNILDGSGAPLPLTTGDIVRITTFSEDISLGIRTEVYTGSERGVYPLGDVPFDSNSVWVSVNGKRQYHRKEFILQDEEQGYDSEYSGYDTFGYDDDVHLSAVFKEFTQTDTDVIVITYFTGIPAKDPIAFRMFKDIFGNRTQQRICDEGTTFLAAALNTEDTEIVVEDSTILGQPDVNKNVPGIVFIRGERIKFWEVDTTVPGAHRLKRVLRGTAGSGININLDIGEPVRDSSLNQVPPGEHIWSFNSQGLQHKDSEFVRFLLKCPGTHNLC